MKIFLSTICYQFEMYGFLKGVFFGTQQTNACGQSSLIFIISSFLHFLRHTASTTELQGFGLETFLQQTVLPGHLENLSSFSPGLHAARQLALGKSASHFFFLSTGFLATLVPIIVAINITRTNSATNVGRILFLRMQKRDKNIL